MQFHIDPNNKCLFNRRLLFLIKENTINKKLAISIKVNSDISVLYSDLLRLSYLIGEPFDGKFGLKNIIYNIANFL